MSIPSSTAKTTGFVLAVMAAALLVTGLIYFPCRASWFALEDYVWLEKISLRKLLSYFYSSWGFCNLYRPVMRVSFYLDLNLFGENPLGWHLHSWLIHAANAGWIFLIIRRLSAGRLVALCACLLFVTSPLARENLTWISARTYPLCAFYYLGALYAVMVYCQRRPRSRWVLAAAAGLLLAALASYEAAFSFPAALALFLFVPGSGNLLTRRQSLGVLALFAAVCLVGLLIRFAVLGGNLGQVDTPHAGYVSGLWLNLGSVFVVFKQHFTEQLFFPLAIAAAAILLLIHKRRADLARGLALMAAMFFFYLPFSGTMGLPLRFLYLAQAPYWLLLACSWSIIGETLQRRNLVVALLLAATIGFHVARGLGYATTYNAAMTIARSIPEQVKALYPVQPAGCHFVFHNIPGYYRGVPLFAVGFDRAIMHVYGSFDGKILRSEDLAARPELVARLPGLPVKYFLYVASSRRLVEITREEWLDLNQSENQ